MDLQSTTEMLQGLRLSDIRRATPLAGVALILLGLGRRSPFSILLAAVGGALVYRDWKSGELRNALFGNSISYEKGMPTQQTLAHSQGIRVEQAVTVNRSPQDLYLFWRNLQNLPRVMSYLESVQVLSPMRSHWVAKTPTGMQVAWDAEIINDVKNERIGWRSIEDADVPNAGSVTFEPAPGGRGTVVTVNLKYDLPMGPLGTAVAKLFGSDPEQMIAQDLHRFKAMIETNQAVAQM